jgi:hypothetical protein
MKRAFIILAMAGSALAGYLGREVQDCIVRGVENPIGPYQVKDAPGYLLKTHIRTGRVWVYGEKSEFRWLELGSPKKS